MSQPGVPADAQPRQDCASCRSKRNCWQPGIEDRVIVLNLLVCRMKRGINVTASTKLFLELIRPKLAKMAHQSVLETGHDVAIAIHDFESQAVEYILRQYEIGEIAYPLHYLFGFPNGVMRFYARAYRERLLRHSRDMLSLDAESPRSELKTDRLQQLTSIGTAGRTHDIHPSLVHNPTLDEDIDDRRVTDRMNVARDVLTDGHTLSVEQYRVLRFCLRNAKDGGFKRPLNGLHVFLAKSMGLPRAKVTKIYADACAKLVRAVGART